MDANDDARNDPHRCSHRRDWARGARALACALALGCAAGSAPGVRAADQPAQAPGRTAVYASSRNAYMAGSDVRPANHIEGDLIGAGGRIAIDQPVGGDALLAGGTVDVRADIGDDLRTMGGDIALDAAVHGDAVAAGGRVRLGRSASVGGDALIAGNVVEIAGHVAGATHVAARSVTIGGQLDGDVAAVGDRIELLPGAHVAGNLRWASPNQIVIAADARVDGQVQRDTATSDRASRMTANRDRGTGIGPGLIAWYLLLLVCAAALIAAMPRTADAARAAFGRSPLASIGLGFALLLGTPLLAVALLASLVGAPIGLALLLLYPFALLAGYLVSAWWLGEQARVHLAPHQVPGFGLRFAWLALALAILVLVGAVPGLGFVVGLLACVAGLGALALAVRHMRRKAAAADGTAPVGSPPPVPPAPPPPLPGG